MTTPCEQLDWDSKFFGTNIGRVRAQRLTAISAANAIVWARAHGIRCLYLLAEMDPETVRLAEENNFRLVDVRVALETATAGRVRRASAEYIRPACGADVPALRRIAGRSYFDSRFYSDPGFARERCDELYRTWVEKSCHGYADMVLVASHGECPKGYVTCHLEGDGSGRIGLIGVAEENRGLGLGVCLTKAALDWFGSRGIMRVTVFTQARNIAAQRMYERCGFATTSMHLWYHRWFSAEETLCQQPAQ